MPGRRYEAQSGYRYGFNGKEKDKDIGESNYNFGARLYDSRLGKWLSTDPMSEKYPSLSSYNFVANNPIRFIDADGKDFFIVFTGQSGAPDYDSKEWNSLQTIMQKRFEGLVTVSRTEFVSNSSVNYPMLQKGEKYWKVNMTINEEKLMAMAKASAGENASPDVINNKKQEIINKLQGSNSYKLMNEIINSNTPQKSALYILANNTIGFGNSSDLWGDSKTLNLESIEVFDEIPGLSAFNLLVHEVREGFYIGARIKPDNSFTSKSAYPSSHWQALIDQSSDAGVDFILSGTSSLPNKSYLEDGQLLFISFKKQKNGKYERTEISISYENNKVKRDPISGKPITSTKKSMVDKTAYEKEKKSHRENANKL